MDSHALLDVTLMGFGSTRKALGGFMKIIGLLGTTWKEEEDEWNEPKLRFEGDPRCPVHSHVH